MSHTEQRNQDPLSIPRPKSLGDAPPADPTTDLQTIERAAEAKRKAEREQAVEAFTTALEPTREEMLEGEVTRLREQLASANERARLVFEAKTEIATSLREQLAEVTAERDRWAQRVKRLEAQLDEIRAVTGGEPASDRLLLVTGTRMEDAIGNAIDLWGTKQRTAKLIEECQEFLDAPGDTEEVADVLITALGVAQAIGWHRFDHVLERKFRKFEAAIAAAKEGTQ